MIRTGEQFLESIRDGRRVLCGGEMIDDLTTHPKTRGYAQALAEYYDMHHDPEHQDAMTFVDEDGERWAKHWFLPRTTMPSSFLSTMRSCGVSATVPGSERSPWTSRNIGDAERSRDLM